MIVIRSGRNLFKKVKSQNGIVMHRRGKLFIKFNKGKLVRKYVKGC